MKLEFPNFHYEPEEVHTKNFHQCSLCHPNVMYNAYFACNTVDYNFCLTIFLIEQTIFTENESNINSKPLCEADSPKGSTTFTIAK